MAKNTLDAPSSEDQSPKAAQVDEHVGNPPTSSSTASSVPSASVEVPALMHHLPNIITAIRIALTPVLLVLLMTEALWGQAAALGLFLLAAISDYVDGVVARSYSVHSRVGKFLDPLADKVLVLSVLIALAILEPATVPWWAVLIISLRDVAVTGLRTWSESRGRSVPTLWLAKIKTALQLFFLVLMLLLIVSTKVGGSVEQSGRWLLRSYIPYLLLLALVAITVFTGLQYFYPREAPTRRKT